MKVLTLGCSFTYGEELSRVDNAWPYLLARTNNWTLTNLAKSGASNDRNIRLLFNELPNQYDLIIFAWTNPDRFEVPYNDRIIDICVNHDLVTQLPWVLEYYANHSDRFYNYEKWIRTVVMLQSHLEAIKQPYLFVSTFGIQADLNQDYYNEYMPKLKYLTDQVNDKFYIDWPNLGMLDWQGNCPLGPGGHPLEIGHQRIAEHINEHIRNISGLS